MMSSISGCPARSASRTAAVNPRAIAALTAPSTTRPRPPAATAVARSSAAPMSASSPALPRASASPARVGATPRGCRSSSVTPSSCSRPRIWRARAGWATRATPGYAELAMEDLEAGRPVEGHLAEIRRTTRRAADLAGQLLAFSRRHVLDPKPTAVNELLVGLEDLLRCLLGRRVTLEVRPEGGLSPVFADRGQLERVLVNLALNARDAMPGGGELVLRTAKAEIVMGEPNPGGAPAPGRYVTVTVSDTGMGIPAHVLPRIFEPFFTTKEPGKGV